MDTTLSPEHVAARLGKLTASRIADATAKLASGKWGASRANLMADLIAERLTGVQADRFVSKEMLWGIETEAQARAAYEWENDCSVIAVGFVDHPTIPMCGASPDGAVSKDGLVEFKCPNTSTHIDFLLTDEVDLKYRKQMLWQLACKPERVWVDYGSFDPRMPPELQLRVRRFTREALVAELKTSLEPEARQFIAELEAKEAALRVQMRREAA
jgi:hypothetical protein